MSTLPPGITAPKRTRAARGQGSSSKPRADRAPRPNADPVPEVTREVTDAELTHVLAEIFSSPAFVMKFAFHCDICAAHFRDTGPELARAIVEYAKESPALQSWLVRITRTGSGIFILLPALVAYIVFPLVHHGPDSLQQVAPLLGVPKREKETVDATNSAATAGTFRPVAPTVPETPTA